MVNTVRFILFPLIIGLLIGSVAGVLVVVGARLLSLGFSAKQEIIALAGFSVCFGLFGFVDSINRFLAWLQNRA